jgi:hypothetical protein
MFYCLWSRLCFLKQPTMSEAIKFLAALFSSFLPIHTRILNFLVISVLIIWIDSQMGFTYHYFTKSKIEEIAKYNELLKDTSLDSVTKQSIYDERKLVIEKNRALIESGSQIKKVNGFYLFVSYSWLYILMIICTPLLLQLNQSLQKSMYWTTVFNVWAMMGLLIFISYIFGNFLSKHIEPPMLYFLNGVTQISILAGLMLLSFRALKAKAKV